jgi:ATP-dependent DNA ligase
VSAPSAFSETTHRTNPLYVFDVLWSDGEDITAKPIMDRRRVLERIIKPTAGIQVGTFVEARKGSV